MDKQSIKMKKVKNDLSGIYFRSQDQETQKWDNVCFEDLSSEEQDKVLERYDKEAVVRLAKMLADTLNKISNEFGITANEELTGSN